MFVRFFEYVIESQRGFPPLWIFSFSRPSKYQARFREKLFFDPFIAKNQERSKIEKLKKLYTYRRYPIRSIFIDMNVYLERWEAYDNALEAYGKWVRNHSWLYRVVTQKIWPRVMPLFFAIGLYVVMQGSVFALPWLGSLYKKKIWLVFFNFLWFNFFKKIFFCIFFVLFVFFEALSVSFVFIGIVFLLISTFILFKRVLFFLFSQNKFFERAVLVSSPNLYKFGVSDASRLIFDSNKLSWRLSGFLTNRYSKVLKRFDSYQFPFKFDDELFVDFAAVQSAGWLKFDSFCSRVGIYSTFFKKSEVFFFKKRFFKWNCLSFPICWLSIWDRYPNRRFDKFYSINNILYTPYGEVILLKSVPFLFESFFISYLNVYCSELSISLSPVSFKKYPWWVYRERFLFFFYVRFMFFYFLGLHAEDRPFRGDLVKLYRHRKRKDWFYIIPSWYAVATDKANRLFSFQPYMSSLFSRVSLLYTNFWILIFCCLEPFSWVILFPIKFGIRFRKNRFFKLAFWLLVFFLGLLVNFKFFFYFIFF